MKDKKKHYATKLKEEIAQLKSDIYVLTQLENSEKPKDILRYIGAKIKWDMRFQLESMAWFGEATSASKAESSQTPRPSRT